MMWRKRSRILLLTISSRDTYPVRITVSIEVAEQCVQRAPSPWESTRTVVGVGAFLGRLRGFKLVPAKRRSRVPPTSTPKGHNANRWAANCVKIQQDAGRYLFLLVQ
jgi:hypothetical protein